MPNITAAAAVKFANERIRVAADLMGQVYYPAVAAGNRWVSLGSGQAALDQMQTDLGGSNGCVARIIACYDFAYWTEKIWFGVTGLSALFPNDGSLLFDNGGNSQRTDAPLLTGAGVNNVITRCQQFQNWLLSATQSFTDAARGSTAALNTVLQCGSYGPSPIVLAAAGNLINRLAELTANYQATSNANLNTVLQAAVNPNK